MNIFSNLSIYFKIKLFIIFISQNYNNIVEILNQVNYTNFGALGEWLKPTDGNFMVKYSGKSKIICKIHLKYLLDKKSVNRNKKLFKHFEIKYPKYNDKIHFSHGNKTKCGITAYDANWFIIKNWKKVDCKKCLKYRS